MGSTLLPFSPFSATLSPSNARVTSSLHINNSSSKKPERLLQLQPYRTYIPPHVYCHPTAILLEMCSNMRELNQILPLVIKNGLYNEHLFQTKLVSLFSKYGNIAAATAVFDPIEDKVDALYHTLLKGHAIHSSVDETIAFLSRMKHDEVQPVVYNFTYLLKTCGDNSDLKRGKEIHAQLFCNGFGSNVFAMTGIVNMYGKCRQVDDARKMFDRMTQRDLVAWNAIIAGYSQNGLARTALELVVTMQEEGQRPDSITIVTVLPSCGDVGSSRIGKSIHGFAIRAGFASLVNVSTALVDMYSKCGLVQTARLVFDRMRDRTFVSWNSMIDGYAQSGHSEEAIVVLQKMLDEGLEPTDVTIMAALHACADLGDLEKGSYIHELLNKIGLGHNVSVMNSLISMYSKCKRVDIAAKIFEDLQEKTLVSWNAMIAGYSQNGCVNDALNFFCKMQQKMKPDSFTMVSIIPALADISVLRQAKWIHGLAIRFCLDRNVFVMTALVDMYAKCGSIPTARKLFDMMDERHVTTWNAMIDGYGTHGLGKSAVELFEAMCRGVTKPNDVTFLCVLSACSHAGLVEDGWRFFTMMKSDYGIEPGMDHYGAMVDLLGRVGKLDEAWDFIQKMPIEPGINVFGAMLGACRIHKNVELGEKAAERLFELGPEEGGYHVLLSNIYANASMWDNVAKVRTLMEKKGLQKTPGCSLVDLRNEVHTFHSGSTDHPQSKRIYAKLEVLINDIKAAGYVPVVNSIHDVEDDVKEQLLTTHSEKLAIAFALINTNSGTPIHIRKNLRVCSDCHEATKYISLVTSREIIVRDMHRFHHFKNGICTCADYW